MGGKDDAENDIVPAGGRHTDLVSVAGRVHNIRANSSKLRFYDLHGEGVKIQIMASAK